MLAKGAALLPISWPASPLIQTSARIYAPQAASTHGQPAQGIDLRSLVQVEGGPGLPSVASVECSL
jgi:hypothetical protein